MKTPETLQEDIYHVLSTGDGYTQEISEWVGRDIAQSLQRQLGSVGDRKRNLRLSSLGTPCERKLWYSVNWSVEPESLPPYAKNKFIFGDITESHILGLVMAAGHNVAGMQTKVDVLGIKGHRDCVIDGMLFDVKSSSTGGFGKFRNNGLVEDDPFGYLSQLSSYLYGSRHDDLVTYKDKAGFLAFDKQHGHVAVDIYDLREYVERKEEEVSKRKEMVKSKTPPDRKYGEVDFGKSGNKKLSMPCSYCDHKAECWPNVRKFLYSNGPVYLTKVVREPNESVIEVDL